VFAVTHQWADGLHPGSGDASPHTHTHTHTLTSYLRSILMLPGNLRQIQPKLVSYFPDPYYPLGIIGTAPRTHDIFRAYEGMQERTEINKWKNRKM
jgi:hypothetical protein